MTGKDKQRGVAYLVTEDRYTAYGIRYLRRGERGDTHGEERERRYTWRVRKYTRREQDLSGLRAHPLRGRGRVRYRKKLYTNKERKERLLEFRYYAQVETTRQFWMADGKQPISRL